MNPEVISERRFKLLNREANSLRKGGIAIVGPVEPREIEYTMRHADHAKFDIKTIEAPGGGIFFKVIKR